MRTREIVRSVTPPIAYDAARKLRRRALRRPPDWEYVGREWPNADEHAGWNAQRVVDAYRRKLPAFRDAISGTGSIGVPTEALLGTDANQYDQNVALEYAYAVARAAFGRERISILDWGGGFGFMSFVVEALFPELTVDFHVKEVRGVAKAGRESVPGVTFWDDDGCLDRQFDLVSACSSIQYSHDIASTLERIGGCARFVFLNRTPVVTSEPSFLVRQRAYGTSYVGWVLNRDELVDAARAADLELVREFIEGFSSEVAGSPERDSHEAFLFQTLGAPAPESRD